MLPIISLPIIKLSLMTNIIAFLKGKKTYFAILVGILTVAAYILHYITYNVLMTLLPLEGFAGIAGLRLALSSIEDQLLQPVELADPAVPTPSVQ